MLFASNLSNEDAGASRETFKACGTGRVRCAIECVAALLLAVLFLLVFSYYTSPLSSAYGYDAAFFQLVGAGMTDGLLPYRDFFDMKGPYLFIAEWLGQLVCKGRAGAFALQVANLTCVLIVLFKVIELAKPQRFALCCAASAVGCLALLSFTMQGGNLTEELSLLPLMLSLYVTLRYFVRYDDVRDTSYGWLASIAQGCIVGVLAFVRITNAAFVLGLLLAVVVVMLSDRAFSDVGRAIAGFAAGLVLGAAPALAYCFATGTLSDMLYCVFAFGFSYSGESSIAQRAANLVAEGLLGTLLVALLPAVATVSWHLRRLWCWLVALIAPIATVVSIALGNGYLHYATLLVPVCALAAFLCVYGVASQGAARRNSLRRKRLAVGVLMLLVVVAQVPKLYGAAYESYSQIRYHFTISENDPSQSAVDEVVALIPAAESSSVFFYGGDSMASRWYCMAHLYPCVRYMDWQGHYVELSPNILGELKARFSSDPPKYVVTPADSRLIEPEPMRDLINELYDKLFENDRYALYAL